MNTEKRIGRRTIRVAGAAVIVFLAIINLGESISNQASAQVTPKRKAAAVKKVNLNTATEAQLASVRGITPVLAQGIIAARPYRSVDELSKAGLDAAAIDAVRPFVTVGGGAGKYRKPLYRLKPGEKVNLNTADEKVIEALPGIGPGLAKAIIQNRPYGRVEDVMKVRGIKATTFGRIRNLIIVD